MSYWERRRQIEQKEKEAIRKELEKRNPEGYVSLVLVADKLNQGKLGEEK